MQIVEEPGKEPKLEKVSEDAHGIPKYDPHRYRVRDDGKLYPVPHSGTKGVNHSWAVDDVQLYVQNLGADATAPTLEGYEAVEFDTVGSFVDTLKACCTHGSPHFKWPNPTKQYSDQIEVSLAHCPPGSMVVINNGMPIPDHFYRPAPKYYEPSASSRRGGGSGTAEASDGDSYPPWKSRSWGEWAADRDWKESAWAWKHSTWEQRQKWDDTDYYDKQSHQTWPCPQQTEKGIYILNENVREVYHGTGVSRLPAVLEQGFKATIGAGADALTAAFGTVVPGVYCARCLAIATGYPMTESTVHNPSYSDKSRPSTRRTSGLNQ